MGSGKAPVTNEGNNFLITFVTTTGDQKTAGDGRNFLSPVTYVGSGMDNFSNDL